MFYLQNIFKWENETKSFFKFLVFVTVNSVQFQTSVSLVSFFDDFDFLNIFKNIFFSFHE